MVKESVTRGQWIAFFCRFMLGLIFLMAGWYKCFEMGPLEHANRLFVEPYSDSWIPYWMLLSTGYLVPVVELLAGVLLVIGWKIDWSLIAIGFVLLLVTYGHLLKEPLFSIQAHIFPRTALMAAAFLLPRDPLSLDHWLAAGGKPRK